MAAKYRKIDTRIWNDAKFSNLSDQGKLVFFMLLTHPNMTSLGAMRASLAGLAEELGWLPEAFREAFREALAKGMVEHDQKACLIALPNFVKYNPPESPNVVKAWAAAADLLPECRLKTLVIQRAKAFAEGFGEAFAKAYLKTMPNQEQEQEQEQEKKTFSSEPPSATREQESDGNSKTKKPKATRPPDPPDESPVVLTFPVVGNPDVPTWDLRASQVEAWSKIFPGVNVTHECRKALGWIQVNPAKTKTTRGMPKFLYSWLERETNRGNVMPRSRQPALPMPISSYDTNTLNNSASEV